MNITSMDNPEAALATSMSSMDEEVVTEVALAATAVASKSMTESVELRELKLESIRYQNEMIADEEKFREDAKKKSEGDAEADKEKEKEKELHETAFIPDQERVQVVSPSETLVVERVSSVDAVPVSIDVS